jgi:tryptophan synthase alpha chain
MKLILETTKSIHKHSVDTPIVYLTYLNPIMQYGLEKFFQESYESGVRGIVIPDIPFDAKDYDTIFTHALNAGINIINLITPATKPDRIKLLKEKSSGFIYYVTSYGVTGERKNLDNKLAERIQFVKDKVGIPVCAGFGISTPEQAMEISNYADGVIIGSAIQKIIESNSKDSEICVTELYNFVRQVRDKML